LTTPSPAGRIRRFREPDLRYLEHIYAQAVSAGFCTADLEPPSAARWMRFVETHADPRFPVWVFEEREAVIGYAHLSPWREGRAGLARCAEVTYYVDFRHHGRGIGAALLDRAMAEAGELGYRSLLAILLAANEPSRRLLERHGFHEWGRLPGVFRYAGGWHDQLLMGRSLDAGPAA
jgi:L-amino acid N-acyltransferase YncA